LGFVQMEPAHLQQYISLFAIGILAGRNDWLASMPTDRALPWLVLGIVLGLGCYLLVGSGIINHMNSQSLVVCVCVCVCVGGSPLHRDVRWRASRVSRIGEPAELAHSYVVGGLLCRLCVSLSDRDDRAMAPHRNGSARRGTDISHDSSILLTFLMSEYVVLRIPGIRRILGS
jgi:hypothetical protein